MAYIVLVCIVMAYVVLACIVMAYIVLVCIVMAYIVLACIVMAYTVMAYGLYSYGLYSYGRQIRQDMHFFFFCTSGATYFIHGPCARPDARAVYTTGVALGEWVTCQGLVFVCPLDSPGPFYMFFYFSVHPLRYLWH